MGEFAGPRSLRQLLDAVLTVGSDLDLSAMSQRIVEAAVDLVDARYGARAVAGVDEVDRGFHDALRHGGQVEIAPHREHGIQQLTEATGTSELAHARRMLRPRRDAAPGTEPFRALVEGARAERLGIAGRGGPVVPAAPNGAREVGGAGSGRAGSPPAWPADRRRRSQGRTSRRPRRRAATRRRSGDLRP